MYNVKMSDFIRNMIRDFPVVPIGEQREIMLGHSKRNKDRVICGYAKDCYLMACKFSSTPAQVDDLFQAAMRGVILAARTYNGSAQFNTHARWQMRYQVQLARETMTSVSYPRDSYRILAKYRKTEEQITSTLETIPTFDEVCDHMRVKMKSRKKLYALVNAVQSIYGEDEETLYSPQSTYNHVREIIFREELEKAHALVQARLTKDEQEILEMKIDGKLSRKEIADKMGIDLKVLADRERVIKSLVAV